MARQTNKAKYEAIRREMLNLFEKFIADHTVNYPKVIYIVSNGAAIRELYFDKAIYSHSWGWLVDKPNSEDIIKIADHLQMITTGKMQLEEKQIQYIYREVINGYYKLDKSQMDSISTLPAKKNGFTIYRTREEAEAALSALLNQINYEKHLLYHGHTMCTYCKKIVPDSEIVESNIIFQSSRQKYDHRKGRHIWQKYVAEEKMKFCSKQCADNEQMSREG